MQAPKLTNEGKIRNKFYDVLFLIKPRLGDFFLLHVLHTNSILEIFYANHNVDIFGSKCEFWLPTRKRMKKISV